MSVSEFDLKCINTIRMLSVDGVQKAKSGHPGLPMGAAPMAYVLWTRFLKHNPADPTWANRDRFVLSAGHGSMLLYSLLYLTGYDLPLEQLQQFRQWGSLTPGHPEYGLTAGVETTTGPLGQGFANGVGMAIAEQILGATFNTAEQPVMDHYTYAIVSDGDLMEGVASEAASMAGHLKLGKLIYLYDDNAISIEGSTSIAFTEDVGKRFEAYGWHVLRVSDGTDLDAIEQAIQAARDETERPSLVIVKTIIGYGSPNKAGTAGVHGAPLGEDEVRLTKENLGWPLEPAFYVPDDALAHFRQAGEKGQAWQSEWQAVYDRWAAADPGRAAQWQSMMSGDLPDGWDADLPVFTDPVATRNASNTILNALAPHLPELIGGSADLEPSNKTYLKGYDYFQADARAGRNFHFGVREHAMGAVANGMAVHGGLLPYCATFLVFSDYMRGSIRLAAMSKIPTVFVFSHDSIGLGEDGPTHQPIEQIMSLRLIPNLDVFRPADANETAAAWRCAVSDRERPCVILLTRQKVPSLNASPALTEGVERGAYVLSEAAVGGAASGKPDVLLIATGSEVELALKAQVMLAEKGAAARVVSMPCWERFARQPQAYRDSVLPPDVSARVAVEAGIGIGWEKWTGSEGAIIAINRFGASAPYQELYKQFGLTPERITETALAVLGRA
ncbi:MAG: transketolase [Anaerolineae bacterium]|nr:transketolase [Anaerolineae bacterium]